MADPVLISNEAGAAGSKGYTLPPNLAFRPTAVTALFDGSGSGSDFLACLTFYSQSGQIIARQFPDASIPAGETVEVSYAPFLNRGAAAASLVGATTWISGIDGGEMDTNTFTDVQFDGFEYNALGVTTADLISFNLPGVSGSPLYSCFFWTEIDNSPAIPASNWQAFGLGQIPEGATMYVSGSLATDYKYILTKYSLLFGGGGDVPFGIQVYQDTGAPAGLSRCGLALTYLGEYQ